MILQQYLFPRRVGIALLFRLILAGCGCLPGTSEGAALDTHTVVLDGEGKIVPWTPNPADGYDRVMFLSWDLLKNRIPLDPANGLPVTYTHSEYNPGNLSGSSWPNNPGSKNAALADSALLYYAYSGDASVVDLVRGLLDHHLQYGTTPANYVWSNVPWSAAAAGSISYGNDSLRDGVGVVQPDKVGELGYYGYLKFYELTGNSNYLNAAIACADALAQHVRDGDATHSPWAFRVLAQTGAIVEEYTAHMIGPILLFDELMRLGLGNTNSYQIARQKAWDWLMTYPMANGVWVNYAEDGSPVSHLANLIQFLPGYTARYLLEHPERDPDWFPHVTNLLGFIETTFGGTDNGEPGLQYGARVISEQLIYKYKMASHTARFGALNAMLYEATGDLAAREKAYRSLNWSTYMCRSNGVVIEGPAEFVYNPPCWFSDGHGDYIRHFMLALGAVPEWAPAGQNHITRSTSVIKSVAYATDGNSISYTTFDNNSTETLRTAFTPAGVYVNGWLLPQRSDLSQPGWVFTASNGVLRVRHDTGTNVQIVAELPDPTLITVSLPDGVESVAYSVTLAASGGTPPYGWSVASGSLPLGLTLDPTNGVIVGTPGAVGTFDFTAQVSDSGSPVKTATRALNLTVAGMPISLTVTPVNATILVGGTQPFTATGTYSDGSTQNVTSQVTWTSGNPGVAPINAVGLATAAAAGTATISAALGSVSGSSTLTVQTPPVAMTTPSLPNGTLNTVYAATLTASGGITPYTWSLAGGTLPPGLTLNPNSGAISGTPTAAGTFNLTARVSDASSPVQSVSKALSLFVASAPATIGNTNEGTLTDVMGAGWINAGRFQAASDLTVTTLSAKVGAITGRYKCAIYADSGGLPGGLLQTTVEVSNPGSGWSTFPLTSALPLTGGQYYWLAIWSDNASAQAYYTSGGTLRWRNYAYGTWPSPFGSTAGAAVNYCVYASGRAAPPPVLGSIAVTPANPTTPAGGTQQFVATGMYSDGSTQNVTSQVSWTSSSPAVAIINASGLATGVTAGTTTISATVLGVSGNTSLTVPPTAVAITTTSLPNGKMNLAYATTLTASGGTTPYTWSVISGSLPGGLALNLNSGAITGTPASAGNFNFTAQVSDSSSPVQSVTKPLSLFVVAAPTMIGNTNDGTLTDAIGAGWINAGRFQATANLTVNTMFAKVAAITGRYKCAIYSDSGGQPSRWLRSSTEVSNPGTGWQTFPLTAPQTLTNGQFYWLAIWSDAGSSRIYYSSTSGTIQWGKYAYGTWPDPIVTTKSASINFSIYATDTLAPQLTLASINAAPVQPVILSIGTHSGAVTITWSAVEGQNYVLEYVDNLGEINWVPLLPPVLATGTTVTVTDDAVGNLPQRFYRVNLVY